MDSKGYRKIFIALLLMWGTLAAQPLIDARGVGLCGTYTVASRGYQAVGFNPANLGFVEEVPFSMSLLNSNFMVRNNFITLDLYDRFFTGDPNNPGEALNLEARVPGKNYTYKTLLKDYIPDSGLLFDMGTNISFPGLNFSWGNYAITSGLQVFWETNLPRPFFSLMLELNPVGSTYDLSFHQDILIIQNLGFSFAIPFPQYKLGFTVKYLAGIGYAAVDSSNGYFHTGTEYIVSESFYQNRQAIGGDGIALDIGFTTDRMDKWQFGAAVNNIIGQIYWGRTNYINRNVDWIEAVYPIRNTLGIPVESGVYSAGSRNYFIVDSVNAQTFFTQPPDSLFKKSSAAIPDSLIGKFSTNYPAIFRMGAAYFVNPEVTLYLDLSTGFSNYYFSRKQWRLSVATEVTHFKYLPLRTGLAWGGEFSPEMSFGIGFATGWADISLGLRMYGGYSITKATGFQVAIGASFRRLKPIGTPKISDLDADSDTES
ncbi:MAG: DUF5723 family protein [Candidatus Marinimicrobia bacterium]|nr:DUF5723 family protein [Candidatus Neomarinimicrobiota bacterium]MCF7839401.1 DUF5723 family protein [Candidatus Neomarinimicrobiota bacterium]MCF7902829.1 DUF5723 family protein [Candidatus Neomarinimicrobiota bacterium]